MVDMPFSVIFPCHARLEFGIQAQTGQKVQFTLLEDEVALPCANMHYA